MCFPRVIGWLPIPQSPSRYRASHEKPPLLAILALNRAQAPSGYRSDDVGALSFIARYAWRALYIWLTISCSTRPFA